MMDDETRWQDAALAADQLIGPFQPEATEAADPIDYDELETGIASIFAAMQASADEAPGEDEAADEAGFDDETTYQLLGELDRLWQRHSP
jgi:hypothetical protein